MSPVDALIRRHRLRAIELLPWVIAIAAYFGFDDYLSLGSQILIMILFALSLDLVLGYAGIVTLGHSAFFGVGAYAAGIYAVRVSGEPLSGLLVGAAAAAAVGWASGLVILRTQGLTLLMLTLADHRIAGRGREQGELRHRRRRWAARRGHRSDPRHLPLRPVRSHRLSLLPGRAVRRLAVRAPPGALAFGRSLVGIRENTARMHAIGSPVRRRLITVYTISAALAGIAGALLAQTTQFVGLTVLGFQRSGEIVIMLVFGGIGRLYGAFVGASLYMIAQDQLAKLEPAFWYFWIGLLLVLLVMFARGGVLGLIDRLLRR